jgi:hypothetical protein
VRISTILDWPCDWANRKNPLNAARSWCQIWQRCHDCAGLYDQALEPAQVAALYSAVVAANSSDMLLAVGNAVAEALATAPQPAPPGAAPAQVRTACWLPESHIDNKSSVQIWLSHTCAACWHARASQMIMEVVSCT